MHLDRAYDSSATRQALESCGLIGAIYEKGKPAPFTAGCTVIDPRPSAAHHPRSEELLDKR